VKDAEIEIPAALRQLQDRLKGLGTKLTDQDLRDLVNTRFRGGQPRTVEEWYQLYSTLLNTTQRKKP